MKKKHIWIQTQNNWKGLLKMYSPNPLLCMGTSLNPLLSRIFQASKSRCFTHHSLGFHPSSENPSLCPIWISHAVVCNHYFLLCCLAPPRTVCFQAVGSIHLLPTYIAVRLPSTASLPSPQTLEQRRFWQLFWSLQVFLHRFWLGDSKLKKAHSSQSHGSCQNSREMRYHEILIHLIGWHFGACGA